jgi:Spy/CpxP family protein refolding chaperone
MKRRMIMAVAAGAMVLAGAYAFAQGPGGPGRPGGPGAPGGQPPMRGEMMHGEMMQGPMHGPMMRGMFSEALDRALDRASVTPEQRVAIYGARDRVVAAMDAQRPDPKARRDRMLALFEGAQLTQAELDAVHQQADQRRQAIRAAFDRAIIEVHGTLTPAQRKIVAEYFRTHGPGGFGFHGRPGPHGPGALGGPGGPGMGGPALR